MLLSCKTLLPSRVARSSHHRVTVLPSRVVAPRRATVASAGPPGRPATEPVTADVYKEDAGQDQELMAFQVQQKSVARPTAAEAGRTMVALAKWGMLCTMDTSSHGYPLGSVVEYACTAEGMPVFAVSSLSAHTKHLEEDGRVSLTVMPSSFQGLADARFTLQGTVRAASEEERPALREAFLRKYPDAFWVDFADFRWFVMDSVLAGRYNGGFAQAKKLTAAEYTAAKPDPVAAFSEPVCNHMNADHQADNLALVKQFCGLSCESVRLLDLDRLGINCVVKRKGQSFKVRLPFIKPAEDRKGIKEAIVEMTKAAAKAPSS